MTAIAFPRDVYDDIVAHAREGHPDEVCGVLGGERGPERTRVATTRRATNVAASPRTAYAIDPEEQLALLEAVEDEGHDVVGFYHSHPAGPTAPSATDAARATWSGYSYVVVSLDGEPSVGSWRWDGDDGAFEAEDVRVVES